MPCWGDMWGIGGAAQFNALELPDSYAHRIEVLRDLVRIYDTEIAKLDHMTHTILRDDAGYNAIQAIYGVGRVFAAVFVAEIGDVERPKGGSRRRDGVFSLAPSPNLAATVERTVRIGLRVD